MLLSKKSIPGAVLYTIAPSLCPEPPMTSLFHIRKVLAGIAAVAFLTTFSINAYAQSGGADHAGHCH